MSDLSLKRIFALAAAVVLAAGAALAASPGARYETRMVYDESIQRIVLFGGVTNLDSGTRLTYDLGDTWEWNGQRWVQRFLDAHPSNRSGHVMVYDSTRGRVLLFGGKQGATTYLNDTWSYKNGQWTQLTPATSPSVRVLAGGAYDRARDRFVLFGGTTIDSAGTTSTALHDTWEFDGTNWTRIAETGPEIAKPLLEYDRKNNLIVMLGIDSTLTTHMFTYDGKTQTWTEQHPTTLPPCVNEGELTYDTNRDIVMYTGGSCGLTSSTIDEPYEWDGSNWKKIDVISPAPRLIGAGYAYDQQRQLAVLFGGFSATNVATTYLYSGGAFFATYEPSPGPRSLFSFTSDPENKAIWMYGGLDENNDYPDFWKYQGNFQPQSLVDGPDSCPAPNSAFDTNRHRLVLMCGTNATWELDPVEYKWTNIMSKEYPKGHRFASMVYDDNLKKIVFFGGYDGTNYLDETWTWDGSQWTRVKKNPAPSRAITSMWYDPIQKKTVIYGGIGRLTPQDRITRYSDMWTFDGTGWTEIKPATVPGTRYGALIGVDPRNGHALLFGGLQLVPNSSTGTQVYASDTWDWDGTTWKKITTATTPPARENGGLAFDPSTNQFVMFGGYAGYFLSDLWTFDGTNWAPRVDSTLRRRASRR